MSQQWTRTETALFEKWLSQYHPDVRVLKSLFQGDELDGITMYVPDSIEIEMYGFVLMDEFTAILEGDCVICTKHKASKYLTYQLDGLYAGVCALCAETKGDYDGTDIELAVVKYLHVHEVPAEVQPSVS
jgi:hypothetical protein